MSGVQEQSKTTLPWYLREYKHDHGVCTVDMRAIKFVESFKVTVKKEGKTQAGLVTPTTEIERTNLYFQGFSGQTQVMPVHEPYAQVQKAWIDVLEAM